MRIFDWFSNKNKLLLEAVANGDLMQVDRLLQKGADANTNTPEGKTVLMQAVQNGNVEILKVLLEAGATVNTSTPKGQSAWSIAVENGHTDAVKALLNAGVSATARIHKGITPLYIATQNGRTDVVKILLKAGAVPNAKTHKGTTPLYIAAQNGHTEIIKVLLDAGADINIKTSKGKTALCIAVENNRKPIVKLLSNDVKKAYALYDKSTKAKNAAKRAAKKERKINNELSKLDDVSKARCTNCRATINGQALGDEVEQCRGLCDACAMQNYVTGHSVQDMTLRDGSKAKIVKHIPVGRTQVENLDVSDVEEIERIVAEELRQRGTYQPWNLTISGYENDSRELLEIPEVRAWCKKCIEMMPHLLALLSQDAINWFVFCVVNVKAKKHNGKLQIDMQLPDEDVQMLVANGIFTWNFFASCGVEETEAGRLSRQAQRRLPWFKDMPEL